MGKSLTNQRQGLASSTEESDKIGRIRGSGDLFRRPGQRKMPMTERSSSYMVWDRRQRSGYRRADGVLDDSHAACSLTRVLARHRSCTRDWSRHRRALHRRRRHRGAGRPRQHRGRRCLKVCWSGAQTVGLVVDVTDENALQHMGTASIRNMSASTPETLFPFGSSMLMNRFLDSPGDSPGDGLGTGAGRAVP